MGILAFFDLGPHLLAVALFVPGLYVTIFAGASKGKVGDESGQSEGKAVIAMLAQLVLGVASQIVIATYLFNPGMYGFAQLGAQSFPTILLGGIVVACGLAFIMWALVRLGGNWVGGQFLRERHELVTTGPYRWVRHPIYVGYALCHVGLLIATLNLAPFVVDGALRALLLHRSIAEENLLQARFGEQYTAYAARTGRFIPRIRRL